MRTCIGAPLKHNVKVAALLGQAIGENKEANRLHRSTALVVADGTCRLLDESCRDVFI